MTNERKVTRVKIMVSVGIENSFTSKYYIGVGTNLKEALRNLYEGKLRNPSMDKTIIQNALLKS